jgi:1,4-alpha-glucan branching enzyme
MMGWMHDTLSFFQEDPVYRKYHQSELTFSLVYAFTENLCCPLSHDEVVYGKNSLINKMPGDGWQQFANLRLLYGYMYGHPGAKLLFMGGEFGQHHEWQHDYSLDWHENGPLHEGMQKFMTDLNSLYKTQPALYEQNYNASGFEWIAFNDIENSVISWLRKSTEPEQYLLFVANFTPVVRVKIIVLVYLYVVTTGKY